MSLSLKNIKKLVFGGVYRANSVEVEKYCSRYTDRLNDQKYGWWIPVHTKDKKTNEDKYYMIDTYQISGDIYKNRYANSKEERFKGLIEGLESLDTPIERGNWVSGMPFNYYYSAIVKLDDNNIKIFKLVADLHEYRLTDDKECRDYSEEDVIEFLQLYNEHCYSSGGITIVKKDAKINYANKINAKISDIWKAIHEPYSYGNYDVDKLLKIEKEAIENNAKYNKRKLDAIIKYNDFINNLKAITDKYKEEIREDLYSSLEEENQC